MTTNTNTPEAAEQDNIVPMDAMNDPINPPPTKKERDEYKKKKQQERIGKYVVGGTDLGGNTISKIYSRGDEYVIYEVANLPPHESMLVFIDSIIEEDDSKIEDIMLQKSTLMSLFHIATNTTVLLFIKKEQQQLCQQQYLEKMI